jgi:hypothetical protein
MEWPQKGTKTGDERIMGFASGLLVFLCLVVFFVAIAFFSCHRGAVRVL